MHCRKRHPLFWLCPTWAPPAVVWSLSLTFLLTTCRISPTLPPWLMLQQCSSGIEHSPFQTSLRLPQKFFTQTRPPKFFETCAYLINWKRNREQKEQILNCLLLSCLWDSKWTAWCQATGGSPLQKKTTTNSGATVLRSIKLPSAALRITKYVVNMYRAYCY